MAKMNQSNGFASGTAGTMRAGFEEGGGPLGFLDHLLDEERDSNLFFGDVRFWQHLEHIDTNHIYRLKSLEYRTLKFMFFEAIFYALFLFVLTGYITELRSSSLYASRRQQLDYWAGCHGSGTGRSCSVHNVKDVATLMGWLRDEFAPKAFTFRELYPSVVASPSIYRLQDQTMHWTPRYAGDTQTSVLLGAVRFRQVRVQFNSDCEILEDLSSIHSDCFPSFSESVQSKYPWAPAWTPGYLLPYFTWHPANVTEQEAMSGYQGVYPGDGFFVDMPLNLTGVRQRLVELEEWQWIDQRTRAFVIELTTLNPNVNIFVNNRLLFEFPATGGLLMRHEAYPFRALQISLALMGTDDMGGVFVYSLLTMALHLLFLAYVVFIISKNGLRYFTYFWSVVDLVILLLFIVHIIATVTVFVAAAQEPNLQPEVIADPETFFPVGRLVPGIQAATDILACLGLMSWLKILKYFSLIGPFHPFVRVLERCICNLLLFASLVLIVLFGFAVALHISFGDETNLFSTLRGSFLAVMVAPAGGVDLSPVLDDGGFLGPILIFFYIVVIILLLLNTFMAICVDVYTVSTFQISECLDHRRPGQGNPTAVFLWTYFNALKGVKLVGRERQDEIGETTEQQILLCNLPEDLQIRYSSTKRRMEQLMDSAQADINAKVRAKMLADGQLADAPQLEDAPRGAKGAPALEDVNGGAPQPPPRIADSPLPPTEEPASVVVKRVQLQRMLNDDPVLRDICGTTRAVDVIRRFRVDQSGIDPYNTVAELQSSVARKLQQLEEGGADLSFDELETLRQVSSELHSALTESQKEWRAELLTVMQMSSLLSASLIDLTKRLEVVQGNHLKIAARAGK